MKQIFLILISVIIITSSYAQSDTTDVKTIILRETKAGGKLDYFSPIKGHEYDGVEIKPGLYSTKLGVALYNWGKSNYEMGIKTLDDAYLIFTQFKGRNLNEREKEYIKLGFNKELEK
ncbi:MAG TPA: hypothetical protein VL443_00565 [Cyclobacteriaceae bacterium]|jgi:hypothetical protein|nr:hypothetical protein [Cyclobacteriaceae bacterium]